MEMTDELTALLAEIESRANELVDGELWSTRDLPRLIKAVRVLSAELERHDALWCGVLSDHILAEATAALRGDK